MRVGAIDCGTNSIRLLIADRDETGLTYVVRRSEIVRLGQGVDLTGRIADEAMQRTLAVAREYAQLCHDHAVERVRFVATSASRDAENASEFVAGVREAFGEYDVTPEVVSGLEEATLSFTGAVGGLDGVTGPFLVVDLGGGSTELVRGTTDVEQSISLDIGSVRMTERYLHSDPPSTEEVDEALVAINAALYEAEKAVNLHGLGALVGLAGSVTTTTAHALGLETYDSARIHGATVSTETMRASCDALIYATKDERRAFGFMHPGRVDVIGAGALIWRALIERVEAASNLTQVRVSETDILDGIALSIR